MKALTATLFALAAIILANLPAFADNVLPRGWRGALEVYSCQPDAWFRNSQGILQNPTCVNISGGGNPAKAADPVVTPPNDDDDDEEVTPPDEDDDDDDETPPDDECACGVWEDDTAKA